MLTHPDTGLDEARTGKQEDHETRSQAGNSVRSRLSRIFHIGHKHDATHGHVDGLSNGNGTMSSRPSRPRSSSMSSQDSDQSNTDNEGAQLARQITPMLDPSTNTNPLLATDEHHDKNPSAAKDNKKKHGDVSKHTFYIENTQMRLKCFARNEVSLWRDGSLRTF